MKTKEEIQKELYDKYGFECGDVYTLAEFSEQILHTSILPNDGNGYFHNGEQETDISPFDIDISFFEASATYPYVCWYNK